MNKVSKYATANVDIDLYKEFKKTCSKLEIHIIDGMSEIMKKFIEEHK